MSGKSREQELVDAAFSMALMIHTDSSFKGMSREAVADWMRQNFRELGFDLVEMGMSWGVLTGQENAQTFAGMKVFKNGKLPPDAAMLTNGVDGVIVQPEGTN